MVSAAMMAGGMRAWFRNEAPEFCRLWNIEPAAGGGLVAYWRVRSREFSHVSTATRPELVFEDFVLAIRETFERYAVIGLVEGAGELL